MKVIDEDMKFKDNLADFYVWLTDVHCSYVNILENKIKRIFKYDNPFNSDHYRVNVASILYNGGTVDIFPNHLQPLEEFDAEYHEKNHIRNIRSRGRTTISKSDSSIMTLPGNNTRVIDNKNTYRL